MKKARAGSELSVRWESILHMRENEMGKLAKDWSTSVSRSFIRSCLALTFCGGMAACGDGAPSAGGASSLPALSAAAASAVPVEYTVTNLAENGTGNQDSISPQGKVISMP